MFSSWMDRLMVFKSWDMMDQREKAIVLIWLGEQFFAPKPENSPHEGFGKLYMDGENVRSEDPDYRGVDFPPTIGGRVFVTIDRGGSDFFNVYPPEGWTQEMKEFASALAMYLFA